MKGSVLFLVLMPFISLSQTIVANFSATPVAGCAPMTVNFTDLSTGNPASWRWDFGNGITSTQQNSSITYFLPGSYTIKLIARNATSIDSIVRVQYINVGLPPVVNFSASTTTGCSPLPVQFTDSSTSSFGNIVSWRWDFGDGGSSSQQNPFHIYKGSGNFTVTLMIINSTGCVKILSRATYINLLSTPVANFTHTITQGCSPPAFVTFSNTSINATASGFQWDFGDGAGSVARNPSHSYANSGVYTVKLIATNANGCADTLVKPNLITVQFAKADFTVTGTCAGSNAVFTNSSLPGSVSAQWSFGDGVVSSAISPTHSYTSPGTYQVKLVNNFGSCLDSVVKPVTITAKPTPAFTAGTTVACRIPLTVNFINTSVGALTYLWDFGDGTSSGESGPSHTYLQPGFYTVTLTVTNGTGCSATIVKKDFIQISAPKIQSITGLPVKACLPYTFSPTANIQIIEPISSYNWDFGDGNTSNAINPSHTYTIAGSYTIRLVITTVTGCTDTFTMKNVVNVGNKPVAAFAANPLSVCANVPVNFTDLSTGNPTEWLWIFGTGSTAIVKNPIHVFSDTGYQSVTLIATNFGCSDTLLKKDFIYVIPPVAIFDTAFFCNDRMTRTFIDKSIGAATWKWSFGDGATTVQQSPVHTYTSSGNYLVNLIVTNGACSDTLERRIKVIRKQGLLTVDKPEICRGAPVVFNVINTDTVNIVKYAWFFTGINDTLLATTFKVPVTFTYKANGSYFPAVVTADSVGCADTLMLANPVKIYGPTAAFASASPGVCFATPLSFIDSSITDGIHPLTKWEWNYGDGTLQSYNQPPFAHSYNVTGVYSISLKVTDNFGCTDSLFKPALITVSKSDAAFFSPDTLTCPGARVQFTSQSTGSNIAYLWSFGDGTSSTVLKPSHVYTTPGKYTVSLVIISDGGCRDTVTKLNYIIVDKPVAKFSVSDTFVCQPIQISFHDSSNYASSWFWTFDNGNTSTFKDPVNAFSSSRMYRVKLVVTSPGGCQDSAFKVINVDLLNATLSYNPLNGCAPLPITFTAHSSRRVDYIWNFGDGNSVLTTDSVTSNIYVRGGKYLPQILLRDVRGCIVPVNGADSIVVEKMIPKFVADKIALCDSAMVQFSDSSSSLGTLTYQWSFGDGGTSTLKNPSHFYNRTGQYTVKLMVTSSLFGCRDSITYPDFITVTSTVAPSVTITASDTNICAGKPVLFIANPVNGGASPSYQWQVNGVAVGRDSDTLRLTTLVNQDIVSCVLKSSIFCITTNAARSNTIRMTVADNLVPSLTVTALANNICIKTATTFTATPVNGGISPSYQWKINGVNAGVNSNSFTSASLLNGDVVTCVLTSSERCTTNPVAVSNPVKMIVYDYPRVYAGPDQVVLQGWRGALNPVVTATNARYRWSPVTYLSGDTLLRPLVSPLADITYKLTVTGIGNCVSSDDVAIKVLKLYIPNVFSPNGDGINETWVITNLQFFTDAKVDIFNRYGQLLFHSDGYEQPWDGKYNGSPLPVATYYYVIELKSQGIKPIGGSITILR